MTVEHELRIISLHDAQLECSCDHWYMARTGAMIKEDAIEEHKRHVEESLSRKANS